MKAGDPFWTNKIDVLFDKKRLREFWPSPQLSFSENGNAITRFLLYAGILLSFANKNMTYLIYSFLLIVLLAIVILKADGKYNYSNKSGNIPEIQQIVPKQCTKPSVNNPFANVLMNEYEDNPQRKAACDSEEYSQDINQKFFTDFNQDPYDIFNKKHSQRQFFSTPVTTIPNDQNSFAHWLYGNANKTCKEEALMCKGNEAFGSG